jgi:hypothetical protein
MLASERLFMKIKFHGEKGNQDKNRQPLQPALVGDDKDAARHLTRGKVHQWINQAALASI